MIKGLIFKENIIIPDVYAPYKRMSKYMKQKTENCKVYYR